MFFSSSTSTKRPPSKDLSHSDLFNEFYSKLSLSSMSISTSSLSSSSSPSSSSENSLSNEIIEPRYTIITDSSNNKNNDTEDSSDQSRPKLAVGPKLAPHWFYYAEFFMVCRSLSNLNWFLIVTKLAKLCSLERESA